MVLLGRTAQHRDDHQAARQFITEALSIQQQQADLQGMTWSMLYLSRTALAQGGFAEARHLWQESLKHALELGDRLSAARGLERVAVAAVSQLPYVAVLLLAAANSLRKVLDAAPYPHERDQLEHCVAAARLVLAADAFDAATRAGERLGLDAAIAEALRALSSLTVPSP
jgi:hypothetical protein